MGTAMPTEADLVSVAAAAEKLGVSIRRVQQYCEQGRLGFKIGKQYIIPRKQLEKFQPNPPGIRLSD